MVFAWSYLSDGDPIEAESWVIESFDRRLPFLSGTCGLDNSSRLDDASAYLAGWLKALRDDQKLLLQAAGAAQKAADFILGKAEEREEERRTAA